MKRADKENYLDRIPMICEDKHWEVLEDGIVEITVENKGFYNKLAQKLFSKPRFSFIKLDEIGSDVWKRIDGKKTIFEIGNELEQSKEEAKLQLYERLCRYFDVLEKNRYIVFK